MVEPDYPSLEVVWIGGVCASTLQGAYHAVRTVRWVEKISIFQAELESGA
jgi:hypothetical protein